MTAPLIDVVVPTYNRHAMLDRLITSLVHQSYAADRYRIIVVDDGSSDATWAALGEWALRDRRIEPLQISHAGASAARNRGWRHGTGEIIAFTDDDCIADHDWISELARGFGERPGALGLYGKTVTERDRVTPLTHQITAVRRNSNYRACNIAYRRQVLVAANGFDEQSAYGEDAQLAAAVLQQGPIVFWPQATIVHPPRPRIFSDEYLWEEQLEGLFRLYHRQPEFFRRHWGRSFPAAVAWRLGIGSTAKQALVLSPWILRNPRLYFRFLGLLLRERAALFTLLPAFWRARGRQACTVKDGDKASLKGRR
jgi:glycosyltransferase involved in cell wall biosynthesis